MRRYIAILALLALMDGTAHASIPGDTQMILYNPVSYLWSSQDILPLIAPATGLGYTILIYDVPAFFGMQGTVPAQFVRDIILGGNRGILMKTAMHQWGNDKGMIIGAWATRTDRDADLALIKSDIDTYYFPIDAGSFYGIGITNYGIREQFNNNDTFVFFDDCLGLGVVQSGFSSSLAGAGWPGEVVSAVAAAETASMFTSFGMGQTLKYATMFHSVQATGDLEMVLQRNLSAEFFGARIKGTTLTLEAAPLNTDHFVFYGARSVRGPWTKFAEQVPLSTSIETSVEVPSTDRWVRVDEVEKTGGTLTHTLVERNAAYSVPTPSPPKTYEELEKALLQQQADRLDSGTASNSAQQFSQRGDNYIYLTVTSDAWAAEVWQYVNLYWQDWWGFETYIETVDGFPVPDPNNRDAFRAHLKDVVIRGYYDMAQASGKTLLVHFIGAKNDWEVWQDPSTWFSPEWRARKQAFVDAGYPANGYPQFDLLPGYYILENEAPENTSGVQVPVISTDGPYQYMDADNQKDLALGRWSVTTIEQVLARALKMQHYNDYGWSAPAQYHRVEVWAGELPLAGVSDSLQVMSLVNAVTAALPVAPDIFLEADEPDPGQRNLAAAARLNSGVDLLILVADNSNVLLPAKQFHVAGANPSFETSMLTPYGKTPYCVAFSCGTIGGARTLHPNHPLPAYRQLADADARGFVAIVGNESGTRHYQNQLATVQAVSDLYDPANSGLSMCLIWLKSENTLRSNHPDNYLLNRCLDSAGFEGDPASPFLIPMIATAVEGEVRPATRLLPNYPNPFNPVTDIRFSTARRGVVKLKVYDARGRLVRTLVSGEQNAGQHTVRWRGDDDHGRQIASGVYFYRLEADGRRYARSMTLVK